MNAVVMSAVVMNAVVMNAVVGKATRCRPPSYPDTRITLWPA